MARRFGAFSAVSLAGAAVLVFHTAAFAQQPETKKNDPAKDDAKSAKDDAKGAAPAAEPQAAPKAETNTEVKKAESQQDLPPEYSPPPGYRHGPPAPMPRYPQPPSEGGPYYQGPYYHDYEYGPPPPPYPPYPPPRYYRRYAPPAGPVAYPEPLRYRPFFFGFGLGVSGVAVFPYASYAGNTARVGIGYNLDIGFGLSPRWSLVLAVDGAAAHFNNADVSSTVYTIGPQFFITRNLYARVGIGGADRTYDYGNGYDRSGYYYDNGFDSNSGLGGVAALGVEVMQSYHVALGIEANGTLSYFRNDDTLSTFGINFVMKLF